MLRNNTIQAALITRAKARTNITDLVTADEIREAQWQGTEFTYPNIRLALGNQIPLGEAQCNNSLIDFSFTIRSEKDSSQEADNIAGAVSEEFFDKSFTVDNVRFSRIRLTGLASAVREDRRTWRAAVNLLANVQPA